MPFGSRSFFEAASLAARRTGDALWRASGGGEHAVVTDTSPCAGTLRDAADVLARDGRHLRVFDFPGFWANRAAPRLDPLRRLPGTAVLHPTCTLIKMGGLPDLLRVARTCRETVVVPAAAECCGFAGDRGFVVPELTAAAAAQEAAEVRALGDATSLYSTCRTCEIGMGRAVGRPYRSLIHLVHEAVLGG
jgi:D-lactate dehydrogenase